MESQLRVTPDGKTVFAVWNEGSTESATNGRFAISIEAEIPVEPEPDGGVPDGGVPDGGLPDGGTEPDGGVDSLTTAGCGSCAVSADGAAGDALFIWAVLGFGLWRRRHARAQRAKGRASGVRKLRERRGRS
jgi:MYXO-CTERM domain-containing protein